MCKITYMYPMLIIVIFILFLLFFFILLNVIYIYELAKENLRIIIKVLKICEHNAIYYEYVFHKIE